MKNIEQLEKILKMHFERIRGIDTKNGLLLSVNAFILTAISFLSNILDKKWIITIIAMLSISLFSFVISIMPIFWNKKEKNRQNPLHLPNIWKSKNNLKFLQNDIKIEDYETQIYRVNEILFFKYIMQWIGIVILLISFVLLIIGITQI
ncbi:MAG: hypothetical protein IKJ03_00085 [Mycoplasmataceae bacterium]|nr:hypothetical protein [Mycoplasmataceae bacterium]